MQGQTPHTGWMWPSSTCIPCYSQQDMGTPTLPSRFPGPAQEGALSSSDAPKLLAMLCKPQLAALEGWGRHGAAAWVWRQEQELGEVFTRLPRKGRARQAAS